MVIDTVLYNLEQAAEFLVGKTNTSFTQYTDWGSISIWYNGSVLLVRLNYGARLHYQLSYSSLAQYKATGARDIVSAFKTLRFYGG